MGTTLPSQWALGTCTHGRRHRHKPLRASRQKSRLNHGKAKPLRHGDKPMGPIWKHKAHSHPSPSSRTRPQRLSLSCYDWWAQKLLSPFSSIATSQGPKATPSSKGPTSPFHLVWREWPKFLQPRRGMISLMHKRLSSYKWTPTPLHLSYTKAYKSLHNSYTPLELSKPTVEREPISFYLFI